MPEEKRPSTGPVRVGKEFPTPPPLGLVTQIVPLDYIRAEEGVTLLKQVASKMARLEVVPRSNSVLITDRGVNIARYLDLLRQLDVKTGGEAGLRTYVYPLKHASAAELATTLGQVFGATVAAAPTRQRVQALEGRSLSSELTGFRRREIESLQERAQMAPPSVAALGAIPGRAAAESAQAPGQGLVGRTTIVPDQATNSLVIRTAPPNFSVLQETIEQLDVRPPQVLLEVLIAEVTLDRASQFGINWQLLTQRGVSGDSTRGIGIGVGPQSFGDTLLQGFQGLAVRVVSLASLNVRAILQALASRTNVRVLSTPRVLALNNEEARILVGSEVPFVSSTFTGLTAGLNTVVQFRNVGTQLTVVPTVNNDGYVTFRVLQEVSALSATTIAAAQNAPVITTREAETSAIVKNGHTIVIGGLIGETTQEIESGVPILKDVPILGYLFKSRSTSRQRTELAIFLTPYVVYTDEQAEEDRELGSLPAGAATLEEIAQDRNVLEDRHAGLDLLGRFPDQSADHDRVPVLHDRARLRFARGNHGSVLRRGDRRRGQRAHLLQHAERDVAVIVDGGDDRQLRAHVAKLHHGVQPRRQAAEGGGHERHLASDQDARLLVVQCQHARCRQHAHVGARGECLQDGPHVQAGEADDPHGEALEALQQRIAEALRADPDADPTGRVARNAPLRQELPVDAELAGPVEGHLGDQHFQQDLRGTDVELLDRLLEHREVRRRGTDHQGVGRLVRNDRGPPHESLARGLGALRRRAARDGPERGHGRWSHLGALLERFDFPTAESCELARQAAPFERLHALPRRRRRHGGTEHLPQGGGKLGGAGVLERIHVGAEPGFATGFDVELPQQIEVARDVHAAVGDQHGVGAGHDLEPGHFARHLLEERDAFLGADVVERHDLRDQTQRGRGRELLPDAHRTGRGPLLFRHDLRNRPGLHDDEALALEDRLEHRAGLRRRHGLRGLEGDAPDRHVGEHHVHAQHGGEGADHVAQIGIHVIDPDGGRLLGDRPGGHRQHAQGKAQRARLHGFRRCAGRRWSTRGPDGSASVTVESEIATSAAPATTSPRR